MLAKVCLNFAADYDSEIKSALEMVHFSHFIA